MARAMMATMALIAGTSGLAQDLSVAQQDRLAHLVQQDCGSCHGLRLTGGLGSPITAKALEGHTVAGLQGIILDGIPGTAMPPWRSVLSEVEAAWIAAYLLEAQE